MSSGGAEAMPIALTVSGHYFGISKFLKSCAPRSGFTGRPFTALGASTRSTASVHGWRFRRSYRSEWSTERQHHHGRTCAERLHLRHGRPRDAGRHSGPPPRPNVLERCSTPPHGIRGSRRGKTAPAEDNRHCRLGRASRRPAYEIPHTLKLMNHHDATASSVLPAGCECPEAPDASEGAETAATPDPFVSRGFVPARPEVGPAGGGHDPFAVPGAAAAEPSRSLRSLPLQRDRFREDRDRDADEERRSRPRVDRHPRVDSDARGT